MMILYPIYFGLILISNYQIVNSLTCKNDKDEPLDYYVIYKPPKQVLEKGYFHISKKMKAQPGWSIPIPSGELFGGGASTGSTTPKMTLIEKDIDKESFVGKTFEEIYKDFGKYNYIMFSDKKPEGTESLSLNKNGKKLLRGFANYGKSKGVLAWSVDASDPKKNRAILFLHSVPHWLPRFRDRYYWPTSSPKLSVNRLISKVNRKLSFLDSLNNAHMAVCVNLEFSDIKDLIKKLIISDVQVYDKNIQQGQTQLEDAQNEIYNSGTSSGTSLFSRFTKILKRKTYSDTDLIKQSKTPDGSQFTIYTKTKGEFKDIFKKMSKNTDIKLFDILSRSFIPRRSSLGKISQKLKPKCKDEFAKILRIEFEGGHKWSSVQDESNWAVSVSPNSDLFCFSSLGRSLIGYRESGLMICFNDLNLKSTFKSAKTEISCKY